MNIKPMNISEEEKTRIFEESLKNQTPYVEKEPVKIQPVDQWISVKDRQPQENGFYLTYYSNHIHVSQWFISANWYNENGGNVTNNVERWMPLPEPPQD